MMDLIAVIMVASATIPATAIPIIYSRVHWWRTLTGKAVMTQSVGLALLIDISIIYQVVGSNYPGRDFVRLGVYAFLVAGEWCLMTALIRALRK